MNRILALLAAGSLLLASCGQGRQSRTAEAAGQAVADTLTKAQRDSIAALPDSLKPKLSTAQIMATLAEEPVFDIITNMGTIRVKLYSGTPKHRDNFAKLALDGFYDGILFHRVIDGFMIQCGDPLSKDELQSDLWGTGGPGYNVPAEIRKEYHHKKGALAAARRGDAANPMRESSGSQFYIVQNERNCSHLDGQYTVFGETIEGLDVVDRIARVYVDFRDCPIDPVRIENIKLVEE